MVIRARPLQPYKGPSAHEIFSGLMKTLALAYIQKLKGNFERLVTEFNRYSISAWLIHHFCSKIRKKCEYL